jgi:hypothetical protein
MINNTTVVNSLYGRSISGTSTIPFVDVFMPRDPTEQDINYQVQQKWFNTETDSLWILKGFSSTNAIVVANWFKIGGPMSFISTITGNTGGPVPGAPITNNINVLGDGITVETTGTPGDYTLTISTSGTVPTSFVENVGTAAPIGGVLNVTGIQGVSTHGFSNTVEVVGTPTVAVASSSLANLGTASFNSNHFSADANGFVSATNEVATEYATQSGFAIPAAGVLDIIGSNGITTSATGNTVTINGSGLGFTSVNNQVFSASGTYTPTVGMLYCQIEVVGGGGGGGGSYDTDTRSISGGGGGGGGGYCRAIYSAAAIGASQVITIGAGGTAGPSNSPSNGGTGGTTSVGALLSSTGGLGGTPGSNGVLSSQNVTGGGPGGTGIGGSVATVGSPGGSGYGIGIPDVSGGGGGVVIGMNIVFGGIGGSTLFGGGGASSASGDPLGASVSPGQPGTSYGGGGSGGCNNVSSSGQLGGAGSAGVVIITEYVG